MNIDINSVAMLASLHVSKWSARKYDKKASLETIERAQAQSQAGRFNKQLVAKEALEEISRVETAARDYHEKNSLPWLDRGARILPAARYMDYMDRMRRFRLDFETAVKDFLDAYPRHREAARQTLGELFSEEDYPSLEQIEKKFHFQTVIQPIPAADDFRVSIRDDQVERIRQDIEARSQEAVKSAVADTWNRLYQVVSTMAEKLDGYGIDPETGKAVGVFRDTAVENVRELVKILPDLNVSGDAELDRFARDLQSRLDGITATDLRKDDGLRKDTASAAQEILDQMSGYVNAA